jgi:hypothetical protein
VFGLTADTYSYNVFNIPSLAQACKGQVIYFLLAIAEGGIRPKAFEAQQIT